jgi:hypothetical protein
LQAKLDQAIADSAGVELLPAVSQSRCDNGQLTITGQATLEAADVGALYVVITTSCVSATTRGPETSEVIQWTQAGWDSVATIGMSNLDWNVTGDCSAPSPTQVKCPVSLEPNPTRPDNGTLVVTRTGEAFTAEVVYVS